MSDLVNIYAETLRTALARSKFSQQVIDRLAQRDEYAKSITQGEGDSDELTWRSPEDKARFAKYNKYKDLYFGRHEDHLRPEWLPSGRTFYKTYNLCRFASTVYADLMVGKGVEVRLGNKVVEDYLNDDISVGDYIYNWVVQASVFGFVALQVVSDDQGVDLLEIEPDTIYPEFDEGSGYDYKWISKKYLVNPADVIDPRGRWKWEGKKEEAQGKSIVFEERHFRGYIEYYLFVAKGDVIEECLPPSWYNPNLPVLDDEGKCVTETGINEFMLMIIPNILFMREFVSDYDDIEPFQKSINSRGTQVGRILNIHANPKLMLPESMQQRDPYTGEQTVRGVGDDVMFMSTEENVIGKPEYLTWQSQLEHAYKEIDMDINMACTVAQISPTLIVRDDSTFPEAAATYRLRLTPTLNRVAVKKRHFVRYAQRVIWVLIQKLNKMGVFTTSVVEPDEHDSIQPTSDDEPEPAPGQRPRTDKLGGSSVLRVSVPGEGIKDVCDIESNDIEIRMIPALPQDDKFLVERLNGLASASVERVLDEVDGMSPQQIIEESQRIKEDQEGMRDSFAGVSSGPGLFFGGEGPQGGGLNASPTAAQESAIPSSIQ